MYTMAVNNLYHVVYAENFCVCSLGYIFYKDICIKYGTSHAPH